MWLHYKPSLFQHIGTHSSLKGKVQKLKVSSGRAAGARPVRHCRRLLLRPAGCTARGYTLLTLYIRPGGDQCRLVASSPQCCTMSWWLECSQNTQQA